jgi:uncharacterized protein YfaS (alpha-2-macroglobulin family)
MEKFGRAFEPARVGGRSVLAMSGEVPERTLDWAGQPQGGTLSLPWPRPAAGASAGQRPTAAAGQRPVPATHLRLAHSGPGAPWATVQSLAAVPLEAPQAAGFAIRRSLAAIEQRDPASLSRGDIVRVRLEIDARNDMTWVAVSDPVPAGATILGSGLGRDSGIGVRGERRSGSAWPAFEEKGFEFFRAYYAYVPKGTWSLEYTLRLNNEGTFGLPPTRVEAMYAPEMFGELPNATVAVKP